MEREKWTNRLSFILASIGSAVGLGNAWRFPGLCAKHGGGAYLLAYIICMLILGIPLLMMELAIGRKAQGGAPKALRSINKKAEWVGWAATSNAFVILSYYAIVFAWCILMCFVAFKFATTSTTASEASNLWANEIGVTWSTSLSGDGIKIKPLLIVCGIIAWALIYLCIRKGTSQVGKVSKYTVTLPLIMLAILAVKGFINNPHLGEALKALFIPNWSSLKDPNLWINAIGQSFYSLSIMMAIMFAYGSFLKKESNIALDATIIAFSDLGCSILSAIVLFTTMYSTGLNTTNMSDSGIATAFIIYPTAITSLTNIPWLNAIFGFVFYFMLCTLAIDSAFSILEGVSTAVSDKFKTNKRKTTFWIAVVAGIISILYITGAGVAWLDIVDNWTNQYTLIIIGVLESIIVGWTFRPELVVNEINKNTKKFKIPEWLFKISIKFVAPLCLIIFFAWKLIELFKTGFRYNTDYGLTAEIIAGWIVMGLVFVSGFFIKLIAKKSKKYEEIKKDESQKSVWEEQ